MAHHINPLPGTSELHTILGIIRDEKMLTKALTSLEEERRLANEAIEARGLAGNITSLHRQAQEDRDQAAKELEDAREVAQRIMDEAELSKKECEDEIEISKKAFAEMKTNQMEKLNAEEQRLSEREKTLKEKEAEIKDRELKATQKQEYLESLEKDVTEKRKVLTESLEKLK